MTVNERELKRGQSVAELIHRFRTAVPRETERRYSAADSSAQSASSMTCEGASVRHSLPGRKLEHCVAMYCIMQAWSGGESLAQSDAPPCSSRHELLLSAFLTARLHFADLTSLPPFGGNVTRMQGMTLLVTSMLPLSWLPLQHICPRVTAPAKRIVPLTHHICQILPLLQMPQHRPRRQELW